MKVLATSLLLFIASAGIWAQSDSIKAQKKPKYESQTIFNTNKGLGGFIGFNTKFTQVNGAPTLFSGAEIDLVIGHAFNFGFEGYGMVQPVKSNNVNTNGNPTYLNMGYGGVHLEPVLWSDKLVHLTLPLHLGMGGIAETKHSYLSDYYYDNDFTDDDLLHTDFFMVAEPGAMAELNVFRFMRIGAGISYRFVNGVDLANQNNADIGGLAGNFSLRLGWF